MQIVCMYKNKTIYTFLNEVGTGVKDNKHRL